MNEISIARSQSLFLSKVYAWMSLGLTITGISSMYVAVHPTLAHTIFSNNLILGGLIGFQIGLVLLLTYAIRRISPVVAKISFMGYSVLNGITLSSIFFVYTLSSIAATFFICSGMFIAMALYGYFTESDLTSMRSFLMMGLVGLFIANILNYFFHNANFNLITAIFGVIIFTLLTAYDSQKIKLLAYESYTSQDASKLTIIGALTLYLDFINLFIYLLELMGRKRN